MNKTLAMLACACAALLSLPAGAQAMKPGLWELSNKVSSADGQMQSAMAEMHIKGEQQAVDMDVAGKWLSADCGKLRPIGIPQAK
jgi:hypothetical protein